MSTVQDASQASSLFGSTAKTGKSGTEDTQNRFLSLLVAQMKNQDPLNPLDNAQVTSQMAQLSTVEGIESMNSSLAALAASMGANQMGQAANLIGRSVLVPGDAVSPEGIVGFDLPRPVDQVTVDIVDAKGKTVRSLTLGPREEGVNIVAWDGLNSVGAEAPAGDYTFNVKAVQGGQDVKSVSLHLGTVNSVSQNGKGVQLDLAGDTSVGYGEVRQIF
jgi:flagellar basal-body rod modification protein FlgD